MCGIFGFIGNVPEEHVGAVVKLTTSLFLCSATRGKDASGFAAIYGKSPEEHEDFFLTDKRPLEPSNFILDSKPFQSIRGRIPNIFIGHTRHSTSGIPSRNRNNHPFHNARYSLVHNGTISNWKETAVKEGLKLRTETDSEVLIKLMNDGMEPVDAALNLFHKIEDSSRVAIACIDRKNHRLLLARTNNPTFLMPVMAWKTIFFASTDDIMKAAIKMAGEGFAHLEQSKIGTTDVDKIYLMGFGDHNNPKLINQVEITKPAKPIVKTSYPSSKVSHDSSFSIALEKAADSAALGNKDKVEMPANSARTLEMLPVIRSLMSSPTMTDVERKHFTDWYNSE